MLSASTAQPGKTKPMGSDFRASKICFTSFRSVLSSFLGSSHCLHHNTYRRKSLSEMPSKRKRSGPGYNRDAPSDSTAGYKRSKPAYNQVYRLPSKNISGPGIFVTCVQSKERKAALQFIDLLNEVADRIYPGVVAEAQPAEEEAKKDTAADPAKEDAEGDMDAMRNGAAPQATEEPIEERTEKTTQNKEETAEDDIAAQIAAELKDIKASERSRRGGGGSNAAQPRFRSIETDTECFLFISVSPPFDPYRLVYTILTEVERSGEPRTRFVQRLTPVTTTCAANATDLTSLASTILPQFFSSNEEEAKTFKIDPRIRSHSKLKRNDVIQIIASQIPTAEGEEGGERKRIHNANLGNPDLWIVAEVVKNSAAISVLNDYERYKKMNLQSVAQAANERKAQEHGDGEKDDGKEGRIAASLAAKSNVQNAVVEKKEDVEVAPATGTDPVVTESNAQPEEADASGSKADDDAQQMSNFRLF